MTDYNELQRLAESCPSGDVIHGSAEDKALRDFIVAANPSTILDLIDKIERLSANVKLNLCDYPAIHEGDLSLLISFIGGKSQTELAKQHGCTAANISRKVRRVKARLGWKDGMGSMEIRERAEQLRALASQGAVVSVDLMVERDQLKAENFDYQIGAHAASAEISRLQSENEALRELNSNGLAVLRTQREQLDCYIKDAERYRWLKVQNRPAIEFDSAFDEFGVPIDSVIDAAISKEG